MKSANDFLLRIFIVLSCFAVFAGSSALAADGIAFVQTAVFYDDSAALAVRTSFASPTTAGNLIVVAASWGDDAAPAPTVRDTAGNTYFLATNGYDPVDGQSLAIFYAPNIRGGSAEVTVSFNVPPGGIEPGGAERYRRLIVAEYSGVAQTSPVDGTAQHTYTKGCSANGGVSSCPLTADYSVTSGIAQVLVPRSLVFGATMNSSGFPTETSAGAGFTARAYTGEDDFIYGEDLFIQDQVVSSTGPIASTETFEMANNYLAQMVIFRPAASVTAPPPSPTPTPVRPCRRSCPRVP
jgi:hypothetical protein